MKDFQRAKLRNYIIVLAAFMFIMIPSLAFSVPKENLPETDINSNANKPDEGAVAKAKALQSLTFKMGKKNLTGCLVCHSDENLSTVEPNGKKLKLYVDPKKFADSVHGEVGCVGCHVGWGLGAHKPPMTDNWREVAKMACKDCHIYQYKIFQKGKHFEAMRKGKKKAPTCFDCHGNHDIVKAKASNSPMNQFHAPEVCGKCHEEQLHTFDENYHGKTLMVLNNKRAPSCFTCHGNHDNKNLKNMSDAVNACSKCHKTANARLVRGFLIHADENSYEHFPALFIAKWAMTGLLVGVFAFFYPHTALLLRRKIIEGKKKRH